MEFSKQKYWRRLPFPSEGNLPNPGIKPRSPALQVDSLLSEPPGEPMMMCVQHYSIKENRLTALKTFCALPVHLFLPPTPTTHLFTVSIVLPFPDCHTGGIIWYITLLDWLLFLNNMHSPTPHLSLG